MWLIYFLYGFIINLVIISKLHSHKHNILHAVRLFDNLFNPLEQSLIRPHKY